MAISEEQKEARKLGLGGSDAPIVMGLDRFKTPLELYLQKTGEVEDTFEGSRFTEWGDRLEPMVAEKYAHETGRKIRVDNKTYQSDTHPFMRGHIDRRVVGVKERRALEVKTTSVADDWGENGTTEIPNYVMCQIQHYMHVINLDVVDVAVLIGGNDYRQYEIPRMDELIRRIIEAEEEFWDRVEAKVPPEPEFEHRSMTELIKNLYPGTSGSIIELPEVAQKYHDVLKDAAEQRQIYEKIEIGCKNRLAMLLGEASIGMMPDGSCYTRKKVKRKEYVSPASSYMRMAHTRKLPKEAAVWIEDHRQESTALEIENDGT